MYSVVRGYLYSKTMFVLQKDDPSTFVVPDVTSHYLDVETKVIYLWDTQEFRDESFYQEYQYDTFENTTRIQTNKIYLSKPGHRIIGCINGIDEDSCSLTTKLNNVNELSFTVYRIIDGEVVQFYDQISRLYELYIPNYGWFKINEEPEVENDGTVESKSVTAESLEIELQQYDLVDFYINTADENSKEMLATDNSYEFQDYLMFRDSVLFYRDTTYLEKAIEQFKETDGSIEALSIFAESHPEIIYNKDPITGVSTGCWRITKDDEDNIVINADRNTKNDPGKNADYNEIYQEIIDIEEQIEQVQSDEENLSLQYANNEITYEEYTERFNELDEQFNSLVEQRRELQEQLDNMESENNEYYTGTEILQLDLDRQHELSLLWLVLHEHGWSVGFIDPSIDPDSEYELDRVPLSERVGRFEVTSQDIYSFLTQDIAQYYRCIFVFDTDNYRVSAYSLKNVGFNTNIFLSFRNIQNLITRYSDRELYTVFHVQGDEELQITEVNFGEDYITDISYFMNKNHFSDEMVEKYNNWVNYRNGRRSDYKEASIIYRDYLDIASEIYDRVPIDNISGKQYSTMSYEELEEEKERMNAVKRQLESMYVDDYGNFDINAIRASDDWGWYDSLTNFILSEPFSIISPKDPTRTIEVIDYVFLREDVNEHGDTIIVQDFDYEQYANDTRNTRECASSIEQIEKEGVIYYKICTLQPNEVVESVVLSPNESAVRWIIEKQYNQDVLWAEDYHVIYTTSYATDYYRLGQIDIAIFNKRVIDGYYTEMQKTSDSYLDTIMVDNVLYYKICLLSENNIIKDGSVVKLSDGTEVQWYTEAETEGGPLSFYATEYQISYIVTYNQTGKRMRTNPKNQMDYLDDFEYNFDEYGYMYGVKELEYQLKSIENKLSTLGTNGYDSDDSSDIYNQEARKKYNKYKHAYDTCKLALEERQREYDAAMLDVQSIADRQQSIKDDVNITNEKYGFTKEELELLDKYYIHTDYQNSNYVITKQSSNNEIIDQEYQLYLDAVDQLYVESHPQYLWSTTQDNLLLMPEFQKWHGELHVGNFLWVSFRDDYQVKLRISAITINPFLIETEVKIDFTTMTSYKSRRNDYADLLASSNSSMKNQISAQIAKKVGSSNTVNIDTDLIMRLLNLIGYG